MEITQNYAVGIPFNAYTSVELSTSDWQWEGRTLSGLMKEDGEVIKLGEELKYDTQEARISGVWELNKSEFPLKIYLIGQNGVVSVRISEKNTNEPLGSTAKPYYNTFETQTDDQYVPYWSKDTHGVLSIDVIPAEGTIVKSISFGGTPQKVDGSQITVNSWDGNGNTVGKYREFGLSVDFTSEGILYYHRGY